jgi:hypothetical protein
MKNYFLLVCIASSLSFAGTNDKPHISKETKDKCQDLKGHQQQVQAYDTDCWYGALSLSMLEYEYSSPRTNIENVQSDLELELAETIARVDNAIIKLIESHKKNN